MAIEHITVSPEETPTAEQKERIRTAASFPINFDESCPELTDEQIEEFAIMAKQQRADRKKTVLSLRVSPETLNKAKKLGRGYTGILSRLLDLAINNPQMVKKCL